MKKENIDIIKEMSLDEKISLLTGEDLNTTKEFSLHHIKKIRMHDGPWGLRRFTNYEKTEFKSAFPGVGAAGELTSTAFPAGCAMGATWNRNLMKKVGEAIGEECNAYCVNVILGPAMNIKRHPLNGRNFEYLSEDPVLTGELAAAYIEGVQSKGVAACPKHFIANHQEDGRFWVSSEIDERTMRELYLLPFEIAVKKANPWTLMCAYNRVNGILASENTYLMDKVLRQEWGFDGLIISDWGAVKNRAVSLKASLEICMPYQEEDKEQLKDGIGFGSITEKDVDRAVLKILDLQDKTDKSVNHEMLKPDFEKHHEIAVEASSEAMTLLKNNGILPIDKKTVKRIFVIGEHARTPHISGDGSSRVRYPSKTETPLEELIKYAGGDIKIDFAGNEIIDTQIYEIGPMENYVTEYASRADLVVVFVGQEFSCNTEASDRHMQISPCLIHAIRAAHRVNKNIIAVANIGGPIIFSPWLDMCGGLLVSWLGGQGMGSTVVKTLFGELNPSGRLSETFPILPEHIPACKNYPGDGFKTCYTEGLMVGYRYFETQNAKCNFEFGFGLSYTTFSYSGLSIIENDGEYTVSFYVENSGESKGAEVAQLYLTHNNSWISRPEKELKGFEKVLLEPSQKKRISIKLTKRDLSYYNIMEHDWICEIGEYIVSVGSSCKNIHLSGSVSIPIDTHTFTMTKE